MSADDTAISRHGDIIIVKRQREEEEAHHGGVWKIAFADFMTALMAFFLVMWLTNASDDASKKKIAQYFNPIKLNSSTPPSPGLDKGDATPSAEAGPPANGTSELPGQPDGKPVGGTEAGGEDQALFRDPYAVLAEIVAEGGAGAENGRSEPQLVGTGLPGLNGGDAYRDPFDPSSWQLEPNMTSQPQPPAGEREFATLVEETPVVPPVPPEPEATPVAAPESAPPTETAEADALEAELRASVAASPGAAEAIDVSRSDEGIVISLADSLQTGMFQIGSARPSAETIQLVETVANLLKERPGTIVIRGHTDSRPYAGEDYDNWRLSTARAHMAYYMLVRGGLEEGRVEGIEGFADRRLKDPADPNGASNRRIEILLREART